VQGRFLREPTVERLVAAATRAAANGIDAVFLTKGPLGDAITLAASLATISPKLLLGIRVNLATEPHPHPTVLARDMTTLDLICGGRSLLAFTPPFADADADAGAVIEAIALCRAMWREGIAASEGPHYPVAGAINRPRPAQPGGPRIALDATNDAAPTQLTAAILAAADILLVPAGSPSPLLTPPPGLDLCQIQLA
jgi:alkanesulfonate monooxygenase SsuD/methylene tetrahydromethanopterin reductase-like flavin-dependent oxidoreductase (luciferase family)